MYEDVKNSHINIPKLKIKNEKRGRKIREISEI
jgi:hypothetical protein